MKIIISPAKRMSNDIAYLKPTSLPYYIQEAKVLVNILKQKKVNELQSILKCNTAIAEESYQNYQQMRLNKNGVPAILAYQGIQYQYMAASIFTEEQFAYVQDHVVILSALYGALRPLDSVVPYRLELENAFRVADNKNLYAFWQDKPYRLVSKTEDVMVDLASVQYSKLIKKYIQKKQRLIQCRFMEEEDGTLKEKGVYVKMVRGAMVRYLAEEKIASLAKLKDFHELGYQFDSMLSDEEHFIFIRNKGGRMNQSQSFKRQY